MNSHTDSGEKLFVTLDRAHFRVYRERPHPGRQDGGLEVVDAIDLPAGKRSYAEENTDQAGRFPGSRGLAGGMSIDERLPMAREHDRRIVETIADRLDAVIRARPGAVWYYAAGPDMQKRVLERLTPDVRSRLKHAVQKDLANVPVGELRRHFGADPHGAK